MKGRKDKILQFVCIFAITISMNIKKYDYDLRLDSMIKLKRIFHRMNSPEMIFIMGVNFLVMFFVNHGSLLFFIQMILFFQTNLHSIRHESQTKIKILVIQALIVHASMIQSYPYRLQKFENQTQDSFVFSFPLWFQVIEIFFCQTMSIHFFFFPTVYFFLSYYLYTQFINRLSSNLDKFVNLKRYRQKSFKQLKIKSKMPPKKKAPVKTPGQNQIIEQKTASQPAQPKTAVLATNPKAETLQKTQAVKQQLIKAQNKRQISSAGNNAVISTSRPPLSQAEILKMRRQKFNNSGKVLLDEDQKVKDQRIKKFGVQPKQSKQQIEERKRKFANPSSVILTEDQQILRQRRAKFAASSAAILTESADILEERKKKFAKNQQNLLSLDDQIEKSKHPKKGKVKKFKSKDRLAQQDRRERRDKKLGKKQRKFSSERQHSNDFKGSKRSRSQIFGKKKFIKRFRSKNGGHNRTEKA